jgi:hypothetical protein
MQITRFGISSPSILVFIFPLPFPSFMASFLQYFPFVPVRTLILRFPWRLVTVKYWAVLLWDCKNAVTYCGKMNLMVLKYKTIIIACSSLAFL